VKKKSRPALMPERTVYDTVFCGCGVELALITHPKIGLVAMICQECVIKSAYAKSVREMLAKGSK
jgi:hypothetical protein